VATAVALCLLAGLRVATGGGAATPTAVVAPVATVPAGTPTATASAAAPRVRPAPAPRAAAPARPAAAVPPAVPRSGCPVPYHPPSTSAPRPLRPPAVADALLPPALPVARKASTLAAVSGKGLWVTPWPTSRLDVPALVAHAKALGVRNLWVRTGGSRQGWYGGRFLPQLVPQAHAAGITVVAWDFPTLSNPVADARRALLALAAGVDGFSPDVETRAEGTYATPRRVALYLSLVRRAAGARPVVATVPRPTPLRQRSFPYRAFVRYADVFAPMVYWSCKEPGALVQQAIRYLRPLLPVAPVGQAYDMGPEGGRRGLPSRAETLRFLDAAKRAGAVGASLWTVEHAGREQLRAMASYRWLVTAG